MTSRLYGTVAGASWMRSVHLVRLIFLFFITSCSRINGPLRLTSDLRSESVETGIPSIVLDNFGYSMDMGNNFYFVDGTKIPSTAQISFDYFYVMTDFGEYHDDLKSYPGSGEVAVQTVGDGFTIPIGDGAAISLNPREIRPPSHQKIIWSKDLLASLKKCPIRTENGTVFANNLKRFLQDNGGKPGDTLLKGQFVVDSVSYRYSADSILLKLRCEGTLYNNSDITLNLNYTITFPEPYLVAPEREALTKVDPLYAERDEILVNGHGSYFFKSSEFSPGPYNNFVRFNLFNKKARVIIDDMNLWTSQDAVPLSRSSTYGRAITDGVRSMYESLKKQFPELADRMSLLSDSRDTNIVPDIIVSASDLTIKMPVLGKDLPLNVSGLATVDFHSESALASKGVVNLNTEKFFDERVQKLYRPMMERGLIENGTLDQEKYFMIKFAVIHEIGHILGLTHNFAGYHCAENASGLVAIDAVMSYPHLFIPLSLLEQRDQMGFGPHDILSLKYLYADLLPDKEKIRSEAMSKLLKFKYLTNDPSDIFNTKINHFELAKSFYETSKNQRVLDFKQNNACPSDRCWLDFLKAISL